VNVFNLQVREGADEQHILRSVHSIYNDIGVKDLTVEIELYD
jgi:zinc transporter 5/7